MLVNPISACFASDIKRLILNRMVVYPVLAVFEKKPEITLDWEHTDFIWIAPKRLKDYEHVKDFNISVEKALALRQKNLLIEASLL